MLPFPSIWEQSLHSQYNEVNAVPSGCLLVTIKSGKVKSNGKVDT